MMASFIFHTGNGGKIEIKDSLARGLACDCLGAAIRQLCRRELVRLITMHTRLPYGHRVISWILWQPISSSAIFPHFVVRWRRCRENPKVSNMSSSASSSGGANKRKLDEEADQVRHPAGGCDLSLLNGLLSAGTCLFAAGRFE